MFDVHSLTSRRNALRAGLAAVTTGFVAGAAMRSARAQAVAPAFAQEKLAQNLVQYQEMPKDGAMCSGCVNFQAPNACTIVAGEINPKGWCVAYAPKES